MERGLAIPDRTAPALDPTKCACVTSGSSTARYDLPSTYAGQSEFREDSRAHVAAM